jgi:integrase
MSILPDPKKPNHFLVRHSVRQPKTNKVIGLKREGIPTRREAERIEKELIIKVNEKVHRELVPTWGDCLIKYLDSLPANGLTQKTIYQRTKILKAYTIPIWEKRGIESFDANELRVFFDTEFKNNAPTHAEFVYHCINGVFKFAVESGYISNSPMPKVPFKKVDRIKCLLDETQMKTLLIESQRLGWQWYPHYAMALYTGMRNGELYALK